MGTDGWTLVYNRKYRPLGSVVEHSIHIGGVRGSNPLAATIEEMGTVIHWTYEN